MKYQPESQANTLPNPSNSTLSDVISGFANVRSDLDTIKSRLLSINLQMTGYVPSKVSDDSESEFVSGDIGGLRHLYQESYQKGTEIFDLTGVLYHSSGAYEIDRNRAPDEDEDECAEGDDSKYFTKGNLYSAIDAFRHQTSRLRHMVRIVREITCALAGNYGEETDCPFPAEKKADSDLINVLYHIVGEQSSLTNRVFYALDRIEMAIDLKPEFAPEFGSDTDYRSRGLSQNCKSAQSDVGHMVNIEMGKGSYSAAETLIDAIKQRDIEALQRRDSQKPDLDAGYRK